MLIKAGEKREKEKSFQREKKEILWLEKKLYSVYSLYTIYMYFYEKIVFSSLKLKVAIFSMLKNNGLHLYCNVEWL